MLLRAAFLIDGLRLEEPLRLGTVLFVPVAPERGFIGRDGREIFNGELDEHGFVTHIQPSSWGMQLAPRRKMAVALVDVIDGEIELWRSTIEMVRQALDLLALSHGGDPQDVAGVLEVQEDGQWRTLAEMFGSGPRPGSVLERIAPEGCGVEPLDVLAAWRGRMRDHRIALWLRLYRALVAEARWDVRVLRAFSLLEAIGRELYPDDAVIVDEHGDPRLQPNGKNYTTGDARGVVWKLVDDALRQLQLAPAILLAHPERDLWDEVEIWLSVRNAVAHEGAWRPPAPGLSSAERRERTVGAFSQAGRGEGADQGAQRYRDAIQAAAEVVLRAQLLS